jgi:NAD(P)-dependent dehydrogenase (short-subunit alcohol dehydrogenase family)
MQRLDGKIAIITGATSGMGRRTAEHFVAERAKVVVCGRRAQLGQALADTLGTDRCHFIKADVTQEADVIGVIDACIAKWGRVDCLFNNAGASIADNGIETISVEDFDWVINSVLRSAMLGMKHVAHNYDGAKIGQHNQQREHRWPPGWLFEFLGLRSCKSRCHPLDTVRRHAARRAQCAREQHIARSDPDGCLRQSIWR